MVGGRLMVAFAPVGNVSPSILTLAVCLVPRKGVKKYCSMFWLYSVNSV
jgi:hypothetical protein